MIYIERVREREIERERNVTHRKKGQTEREIEKEAGEIERVRCDRKER